MTPRYMLGMMSMMFAAIIIFGTWTQILHTYDILKSHWSQDIPA